MKHSTKNSKDNLNNKQNILYENGYESLHSFYQTEQGAKWHKFFKYIWMIIIIGSLIILFSYIGLTTAKYMMIKNQIETTLEQETKIRDQHKDEINNEIEKELQKQEQKK